MGACAQLRALSRNYPAVPLALAVVVTCGIAANAAIGLADARDTHAVSGMVYPFDPFPEGFERNTMELKPWDVCYLIVHPGYATYADTGEEVIANAEGYGDYWDYLANLEALGARLRAKRAVVVYALEERVANDPSLLPAALRPPGTALRIVTKNCSGRIQDSFTDASGIRRAQALPRVFDFLKLNGIEEIRVAGEAAWYPGPNGYRGCLATLAGEFVDAGFRVRGVTGCVYPSKNRPTETFLQECLSQNEWKAERWHTLYGADVLDDMANDPVLGAIYSEGAEPGEVRMSEGRR